jgi:hypothetical protein
MLQFSLLAFLVSGTFLGRAYFDYYFMIVAGTIILHRLGQFDLWQIVNEEPATSDMDDSATSALIPYHE